MGVGKYFTSMEHAVAFKYCFSVWQHLNKTNRFILNGTIN